MSIKNCSGSERLEIDFSLSIDRCLFIKYFFQLEKISEHMPNVRSFPSHTILRQLRLGQGIHSVLCGRA